VAAANNLKRNTYFHIGFMLQLAWLSVGSGRQCLGGDFY
jgi:hypothetical protein